MVAHRFSQLAAFVMVSAVFAPRVSAQTRSLPEIEPNNAAQTATLAHLGDTISGTVNPDDVDYFAVDLEAGTQLELIGAHVPFCRDFALLNPAGTRLAFGDCMAQVDTLRLTIPVRGRYLIRVTEFDDAPVAQPLRPYSLHIGTNAGTIDIASVASALLGDRTMLDSTSRQWLDQRGNGNGVLDVGDLRAYLRAKGVLPVSRGQK
jgi:hypothetical protein